MTAIWGFPTRIVFGNGERRRTGEEARALGMQRALIVTDPGVVAAKLIDGIRAALEASGVKTSIFDGVDPNPIEANIEAGVGAFNAHQADGVVSVGGGSPLDAGKLIALKARSNKSFEELDDAIDGGKHVPANLPPIITLPTTA